MVANLKLENKRISANNTTQEGSNQSDNLKHDNFMIDQIQMRTTVLEDDSNKAPPTSTFTSLFNRAMKQVEQSDTEKTTENMQSEKVSPQGRPSWRDRISSRGRSVTPIGRVPRQDAAGEALKVELRQAKHRHRSRYSHHDRRMRQG